MDLAAKAPGEADLFDIAEECPIRLLAGIVFNNERFDFGKDKWGNTAHDTGAEAVAAEYGKGTGVKVLDNLISEGLAGAFER